MKYLASILVTLALAGCITGNKGGATYVREVVSNDAGQRTERVELVVRQPKYAAEGAMIEVTTNGMAYGTTGAAQDQKGITDAEGDAKAKIVIYGGFILVIILGGIGLAMNNAVVSNKDALIIMGVGIAGIAIIRLVEASKGVMVVLAPVAAVIGIGYLFWQWKSKAGAAKPAK